MPVVITQLCNCRKHFSLFKLIVLGFFTQNLPVSPLSAPFQQQHAYLAKRSDKFTVSYTAQQIIAIAKMDYLAATEKLVGIEPELKGTGGLKYDSESMLIHVCWVGKQTIVSHVSQNNFRS